MNKAYLAILAALSTVLVKKRPTPGKWYPIHIQSINPPLDSLSGSKSQKTPICPPPNNGWTQYYHIQPEQNITVKEIVDCWVTNKAKIYDHSMPVMISTKDLSKYREYPTHKLRNNISSQKYKSLKKEIIKNGIKEPLYLIVGRDGFAKIGEGNHRHNIALELQTPKIPVWFAFWDSGK
jgi:hypothetical protein